MRLGGIEMEAVLVLEDGKIYKGKLIGKSGAAIGELIFNTSMTGYEEILTDPSYRGQLVILTYPLIGNYGINENELDLSQPHLSGLIIKEHCEKPVHKKAQSSLMSYLNKKDIVGISNIDTRALTKYIRENGNMIGLISSENLNKEEFLALLAEKKREKRNLVKEVSIKKTTRIPGNSFRIVLMDFGVKYNILRSLRKYDIDLIIVPYNTKAEEIYSYNPDGI